MEPRDRFLTIITLREKVSYQSDEEKKYELDRPTLLWFCSRPIEYFLDNFLVFFSEREEEKKKRSSSSSSAARNIVSRFENTAFAAVTRSVLMCNIFFHNLSEAEQAYESIKGLEGVENARMRIMKDLIFVGEGIDYQMKKHPSQEAQ